MMLNISLYFDKFKGFFALSFLAILLSQCSNHTVVDRDSKIFVSVKDQKLLLTKQGVPVKTYTVSTSKFGLGSGNGTNRTPIGNLGVAKKIGCGKPSGTVFKSRTPTGEILKPNTPGRDPIVSRILWLYGKESQNRNTYRRCVYIHGTPEEWRLGSPCSYGCIRMSSKDVIDLYNRVGIGADVQIMRGELPYKNQNPSGTVAKLAQAIGLGS